MLSYFAVQIFGSEFHPLLRGSRLRELLVDLKRMISELGLCLQRVVVFFQWVFAKRILAFAHDFVDLDVLVLRVQFVLVSVAGAQDHRVFQIVVLCHSFPVEVVVLKGICERFLDICCARQIVVVFLNSPLPRSAPGGSPRESFLEKLTVISVRQSVELSFLLGDMGPNTGDRVSSPAWGCFWYIHCALNLNNNKF